MAQKIYNTGIKNTQQYFTGIYPIKRDSGGEYVEIPDNSVSSVDVSSSINSAVNAAKQAARAQQINKLMSDYGISESDATTAIDNSGGDITKARSAAKDVQILNNARTANMSNLDYMLSQLNKRKDALTGDYTKSQFQTDQDIARAKAEAMGGTYGVDTNGNGVIDANENVTIDPRLSTAGKTQTAQIRSDNARGLLNTTLSQGAGASASDALQRQLMQFTGGKQTELANTKKAQDTEIYDLEGSLNAAKLAAEKEGNENYEIDPVTGKYKKKVTA